MKKLLPLLLVILATPALAQTQPSPAPAPAPVSPKTQELLNLYEGPGAETFTDPSKAHRSTREIGDWISETVANSLQFEPGKSNQKLAALKPLFSENGYKAYLAFLASQPFVDALRTQSLKLTTIVNDAPLLIGQGASGGRYAWAFELPVIMTAQGQDRARPIILRLQIGRNNDAPKPHRVVIENWQVFQENVQNPASSPAKP